jgi:hypothetical protein
VHEAVRKDIIKNAQSSNAFYSKILKDLQYIEYLKHVNKFGHVYNDDYDKSDYDPFNKISLKSKVVETDLRDSTNVYQRKLAKESKIAEPITENVYGSVAVSPIKPINLASLSVQTSKLTWKKWFEQDHNNVDSMIRLKSW